jgi:integrase
MAYTDLMDFHRDDLRKEGEHYYISKSRNKTGKTFTAVVFPFAVPIILHYQTLPTISNQKYNKYLKEIDTRLTTHMGRRTYATMLANRGVDMSVVASALGDDVQVASRYYARVFTKTIIKEQISKL